MSDPEEITKKKEQLNSIVIELNELLHSHKWNHSDENHKRKWSKMVEIASELHKIVKPNHHKYMIENRGYSPDDPKFYESIHAVQDLLKFMDNPNANDDPEDITINDEFTLTVYCRRWGHEDTYDIRRTSIGWDVQHISIGGSCDKKGQPFLIEILNHDTINFPEELPGYFEWLWDQAAEAGLSHDEIQRSLDELGRWISVCEKNTPKGIWESFK